MKVMLKCTIFMKNWIPVSSTGMIIGGSAGMKVEGALDILLAAQITVFVQECVTRWNDTFLSSS
ncbi:hypothetical protein, partial [Wolbachia endosymbiont of Mansonella ozzardi]|uniref:hypothetical protein n=1 Tax=Wolbachia endosymbiont of Mansonella ozzardi TaxID=137464 RepID=UPI001CE11F78